MHVCLGGSHTACLQDTRLCLATESTRRQGKEKALPTDVRSGKNVVHVFERFLLDDSFLFYSP